MPVTPDTIVSALVERARRKAQLPNDAQLAHALGVKRATVSSWKVGRSLPEVDNIVALCAITQEDPTPYVLHVERLRSPTHAAAVFWERLGERVGWSTAKIAAAFSLVFIAACLAPQDANAHPASLAGDSILYASCLLAVLCRRLYVRLRARQKSQYSTTPAVPSKTAPTTPATARISGA